jgi:hypothetical protein
MKIIVVSKGVVERCHTLRLLQTEGVEARVVVHDEEAKKRLIRAFPYHTYHCSHTKTLVAKRNWILEHLVQKNDWYIGMDDNIQHFTMVMHPWRDNWKNDTTKNPPHDFLSWRQLYNRKAMFSNWLREFKKDIKLAEEQNAPLVGVASMENPYFRPRRYSNFKFIRTKVFAMKNTGYFHFENKYGMDSWLSAQCVAVHGKVLVDNFLYYKAKMCEEGGLGSRKYREAHGLEDYLYRIVKAFPGLVGIVESKLKTVRFLKHSENSVNRWRQEHGYLHSHGG